ncbi:MAG TPA: RidA family protein [Bryobacteraceae bacterium]|jgi:2-iminobutanoate/2-iminopropanoate deaminase|nr:RidA family protein [Bryobacteraceae bacterium]
MKNTHTKTLAAMLLLALPALAEHTVIMPPELAPAPGAAAPMFSPGILADGTLYVSGELGTDLKTRQIPDEFEQEVKNSLGAIGLILKKAGMDYSSVVSVTVYLSDMELFARMNAVYATFFKDPRPARATIGVAKLANAKARIEISVIAK